MARFNTSSTLLDRRRTLRKHATPSERQLWKLLSNRQLGVKFRRQHSISSCIVDFYCVEHKLAIEIDGSIHLKSWAIDHDRRRQAFLERHGITVLRFTNEEVNFDALKVVEKVLATIEGLKQRGGHSSNVGGTPA